MTKRNKVNNVYDWLALGVRRGYCSEDVCSTHETLPLTPTELDQFEHDEEPCVSAVRLYHPGEKDGNAN